MRVLTVILIVFAAALARLTLFTVDQTETAIVTRFGKPLEGISSPGLHVKYPTPIDRVVRFSKKLMMFDPPQSEYLTADKKNIVVDTFACWRIGDPLRFLQTVRDVSGAEARLLDLIASEIGATVGSYPLTSFISTKPEEVKIAEMTSAITERVSARADREYGVRIVDFRMNRFNFPPQNTRSVINRMKAERERIARKYRSEGEEEALKVEAEAEQERRQILAKAEGEARKTRGEGDAQATRIYAEAYARDPRFYKLLRTLESYEKIIDGKTTLVLPADSDFLRLLTRGLDSTDRADR
ncbi:MAG: protease modulator HflC [Myxococcales bacterium]|nr:protease modulator HflC [Myxococcales bacterium]